MEEEAIKQENPSDKEAGTSPAGQGKKSKKLKFRKETEEEVLQQKLAEAKDQYLRLFAEFDNYRKRTNKEKSDLLNYASEDLVTQLLPVLDDFSRALQSMNDAQDIGAVKEGVTLISQKLTSLLEQKGLSGIEAKGNDFDTDFHEAVTSIAAGEEMKGKVVDEIQKGYLYKDKVIRFSKVVVGQ